MLTPAFGTQSPAAAPVLPVVPVAAVACAPPKPLTGGRVAVPEAPVERAVDVETMEVLPLYGDWAPQGWSALSYR
jgi:hypothetical protein